MCFFPVCHGGINNPSSESKEINFPLTGQSFEFDENCVFSFFIETPGFINVKVPEFNFETEYEGKQDCKDDQDWLELYDGNFLVNRYCGNNILSTYGSTESNITLLIKMNKNSNPMSNFKLQWDSVIGKYIILCKWVRKTRLL